MRMFDDGDQGRGDQAHAGADREATADVPPVNGDQAGAADPPSCAGKQSRRKKKRKDLVVKHMPAQSLKVARRQDDLDAIFGAIGERGRVDSQDKGNPSSRGKKSAASGRLDATLDDTRREEDRLRRKIERKRFMSANPEAMLSFNEEAMLAEAKRRFERSKDVGGVDKKTAMEDFKAIRREIQSFGALPVFFPEFLSPGITSRATLRMCE